MVVGSEYAVRGSRIHLNGEVLNRRFALWVEVPMVLERKGVDEYGDVKPHGRHVLLNGPGHPDVPINASNVLCPWGKQPEDVRKLADLAVLADAVRRDRTAAQKARREALTERTRQCLREVGVPEEERFGEPRFRLDAASLIAPEDHTTQQLLLALGFVEEDETIAASVRQLENYYSQKLSAVRAQWLAMKGEDE